jgi:hypothetical protein
VVHGAKTTIDLVAGEHVTCVYDNAYVPPRGGLDIEKTTHGGVGSFDYRVKRVLGRSRIVTATTTETGVPEAAEPSLAHLAPGLYTISERARASANGRWHPVSVRCNGFRRSVRHPVLVHIAAGRTTTCAFVNAFVPAGSISLAKITEGDTGTIGFLIGARSGPPMQFRQSATTRFTGVPANATPVSRADATGHIALGRYVITEQFPLSEPLDGWTLTEVVCNGHVVPFQLGGAVDVDLTRAHPHVSCGYINTFTHHPPPPPGPPVPPTPVVPTPFPTPTPTPVPTPIPTPIPSPPPGPHPSPEKVSPIYELASLGVTKVARPASLVRGHVVTYRITVTNHGPDPAERVIVADQRLGRARVVSVHGGRCTQHSRVVACSVGTLRTGASAVVTVRMIPLGTQARFANRAVVGTATLEASNAHTVGTATVRVRQPKATKHHHRRFTACPSRAAPVAHAAC